LNLSHPRVIQMVMDSLRYWVQEFHVDGFRFDLAATLGREYHGFDTGAGFFDALMQDPVLARVKLISEPWDIGPGGYQVGRHPPGMAEWNDRFRDDVRAFWRGDPGKRSVIASRLMGSADLFNHHRRRTWASINFVTAHDGFTLQDLVTYHHKRNEANGEGNRDGSDHNISANWGIEGPSTDLRIIELRERIKRAMLMTLMFSKGTPMLLGGDEFGRTQLGNNNAYCQDSDLSWYDWNLPGTETGKAMLQFTRHCIAKRAALPMFRNSHFLMSHDKTLEGVPDIGWFDETAAEMTPERWEYSEGRLLALRMIARGEDGSLAAVLLLLNAFSQDREFSLPQPAMAWRTGIDAAGISDGSSIDVSHLRQPYHNKIIVAAHSAVLLEADHVLNT
jgi:glycogen operon protein